jgi:hypothetical protein
MLPVFSRGAFTPWLALCGRSFCRSDVRLDVSTHRWQIVKTSAGRVWARHSPRRTRAAAPLWLPASKLLSQLPRPSRMRTPPRSARPTRARRLLILLAGQASPPGPSDCGQGPLVDGLVIVDQSGQQRALVGGQSFIVGKRAIPTTKAPSSSPEIVLMSSDSLSEPAQTPSGAARRFPPPAAPKIDARLQPLSFKAVAPLPDFWRTSSASTSKAGSSSSAVVPRTSTSAELSSSVLSSAKGKGRLRIWGQNVAIKTGCR